MGFNWVDIIIIGLLALAVYQGARIGLVTQLFTVGALFATLFLSGWLLPHIIPFKNNPELRLAINTGLVILLTAYAAVRGFDLGQRYHWSLRFGKRVNHRLTKAFEKHLGSLPALIGTLLLVWLIGVGISRLPFEAFSNSVTNSFFVQKLVHILPPVPAVFETVNDEIDPNDQPAVTATTKPSKDFKYSVADFKAASSLGADSVVRITSFGCGGLVSGSGFAAGKDLVVTNAHVVAGVKRPIVKYGGRSYEGAPVMFNPSLDYAVLRTRGLPAPAARLSTAEATPGTTVAVLGYPGGNYKATPGIVSETLQVTGSNIYGTGDSRRQAYGIQAETQTGSSGGPIVTKDGQVIGVIFSKNADSGDYAYALPSAYIKEALTKSQKTTRRVSTGACTAS